MQCKPTQQIDENKLLEAVGLLFPIVARRGLVTVRIRSGSKKGLLIHNNGFVRMLFGSCSVNLR